MKISHKLTMTASFLALNILAGSSSALAVSAALDFSSTSNPNGAWSYGWSYGLGGSFILDTTNTASYSGTGLSGWLGAQHPDGIPLVVHNGTANPITLSSTHYQPGQLGEQPGESNQYVIVRWTTPAPGTYTIGATFAGLSTLGASADVHVLRDGLLLFGATLGAPATFSTTNNLVAGETIDFAVGNGGNGPEEDTTGLSASIVAVPEPGTIGLVAMGLGCLLSFRFLKRK